MSQQVRDKVVAPVVAPTTEGNLAQTVVVNAQEVPDKVVFATRSGAGWQDVTAAQFADDVARLAKGLIAAGRRRRRPGRPDVADPLRVDAGGLRDLDRRRGHRADLRDLLARPGRLDPRGLRGGRRRRGDRDARRRGVRRSATGCPGCATSGRSSPAPWTSSTGSGADVSDDTLDARRASTDRGSLATIIYTSGTTGRPKGCELTHGNFKDLAENTCESLASVVRADGAATLLFLPLAHVFARFIQVLCVEATARMGHSSDIRTLLDDFASFQPTFILAVPRVFEKIYNSSEQKAAGDGKGRIFATAAATAMAWSESLDSGGPGLGLKAQARGLRPARLQQAAGGHGRPDPVRGVRRRAARDAARPLLPGHRCHRPRGLRPHRDHGARPRSTCRRRSRSARSARRCRGSASASPTTARSSSRASTSSRGTATTTRRRPRRSRTAGSTPATSASWTTTATSRSPAARRSSSSRPAARTSRPRCSRTGCAPTRSSRSASSSATRSRSSPRC